MKTITFTAFAKLVEVTRQAISAAAKPGGCLASAVTEVNGKKRLVYKDAALLWQTRNKNMVRNSAPKNPQHTADETLPPISESRQRLAFLKAEKQEMENRQKKGLSVDREVVKGHHRAAGAALGQALNNFSRKHAIHLANMTCPREIIIYLNQATEEVKTEFCDHLTV